MECKRRKSRYIRSKRQIWIWSTKGIQLKVNRVLPREHTAYSKHPDPATQEKILHMESLDVQYCHHIDYFLCGQNGEAIYNQQKQLYTVSELTVAIMNSSFLNSDLNFKSMENHRLFSSVQFSPLVVSNSLRLHELQHKRPLCPSPTPDVHSDSCPSSQ